jgi:predicted RNA-binding Zn-ribbon protein involved in translation (DUF1610 family)
VWGTLLYKIDLAKIEGEGEFPCPSCGNLISPDDESGLNYEILNVSVDDQGRLKEILVACKKCGSKIILEGFELLSEIEESEGLSDTENV